MDRGVLALADVHEAKETDPQGRDFSLDDAYGRAGFVQRQLSEEQRELYQELAQMLCREAKVGTVLICLDGWERSVQHGRP